MKTVAVTCTSSTAYHVTTKDSDDDDTDWCYVAYAPSQCGFRLIHGVNGDGAILAVVDVWSRQQADPYNPAPDVWEGTYNVSSKYKNACANLANMLRTACNLMLSCVVDSFLERTALAAGFKQMGDTYYNRNSGNFIRWYVLSAER